MALYGTIQAIMLLWRALITKLVDTSFEINPLQICG